MGPFRSSGSYRQPSSRQGLVFDLGPVGIVVLSLLAVFLGLFATVFGEIAGARAFYYAAAMAMVLTVALLLLVSRNQVRFLFLAALACFPVVATILPPGRFRVSMFDALMLLVVVVYFSRFVTLRGPTAERFFVSWHFWFAFVGLLMLVGLSHFPLASLWVWFEVLGVYAFFRCCLEFLRSERGFERLSIWLGVIALVLVGGVIFERVSHVNLTMGGGNLNQNYLVGSEVVRRAAGFFQDSQRSAQVFACLAAFFFVLSIKKRFREGQARWIVGVCFPLCLVGIALGGSRAAMLALLAVIVVATIFLIKSSVIFKLLAMCVIALVGGGLSQVPESAWRAITPESLVSRYEDIGYAVEYRVNIWFDTWAMFADQPVWGIGPGSFREYLRTTNPSARGYYGIGGLAGVEYIPDQPESGYLKILYEGGLIGVLCMTVIALGAIWKIFETIRNREVDEDRKTEVLAAALALVVFSISFVTLFTVADERNAAIFGFLLAVIWHSASAQTDAATADVPSRV